MIRDHKERFVNAIQWQDLAFYLHFKLLVLKVVFMIYSVWKQTGGDPTELAEES